MQIRKNNMNELDHLNDKFFRNNIRIEFIGDLNQNEPNKIQDTINKIIDRLEQYERPDIISEYNNIILGIEHFEFDSYYRSNKKGSNYKVKDNQVRKKFSNIIKNQKNNNKDFIVSDQINIIPSLDNYYKNFENIFKNHYKKIPEYIKNIKENYNCENKEIKICFFAEDVTPVGNYFLDKNRTLNSLSPIHSIQIRQLLQNSPLIKYLIIGKFFNTTYQLSIIENTKENIEYLSNTLNEVNENNFVKFDKIEKRAYITKNKIKE